MHDKSVVRYMNTVSLKNIHDKIAGFAITIRKIAMGKRLFEVWNEGNYK
jgi:ribosomal protein S17E